MLIILSLFMLVYGIIDFVSTIFQYSTCSTFGNIYKFPLRRSILAWSLMVLGIFIFSITNLNRPVPKIKTLSPEIVATYSLDDVDVVKNPKSKTDIDITKYNALVVSHTTGTITQTQSAYKGGKIVLHDKSMAEYTIDEVRQSKTVTEPTFKRIKQRTTVTNRKRIENKNNNWLFFNFGVDDLSDKVTYKTILYVPYSSSVAQEAQKSN